MAHEEWRDVVGYEGLYQVSNLGRVRSLDRVIQKLNGVNRRYKGMILTPFEDKNGYPSVALSKHSKQIHFRVNVLVANAFIVNCDSSLVLHHVNGDKHDNSVENLRYVMPDEIRSYDELCTDCNSTDISEEQWAPVVGYENYYEVSSMGRVRCISRVIDSTRGEKRLWRGKILHTSVRSQSGYLRVDLCANGKKATKDVHRLVAEAFLEPIEGKNIVDHINGIKTDNRVENLRYVTPSENARYAFELGLIDKEAMRRNGQEHVRTFGTATPPKPVIRNDGVWFESGAAAARAIGTTQSSVSAVARGVKKSIKGYTFKFAEQTT